MQELLRMTYQLRHTKHLTVLLLLRLKVFSIYAHNFNDKSFAIKYLLDNSYLQIKNIIG